MSKKLETEKESIRDDGTYIHKEAVLTSMAISLKRIADLKEIELILKYSTDTINNIKKELNK